MTAGCTTPQTRLQLAESETGQGFQYVAESYDLYPTRRPEGEAWRLQELQVRLNTAGLCGEGYRVDERSESLTSGRFFNGDIYRVTYLGHCAAQPAAPAPAPQPMYTPMSIDDPSQEPIERLPLPEREDLPQRSG